MKKFLAFEALHYSFTKTIENIGFFIMTLLLYFLAIVLILLSYILLALYLVNAMNGVLLFPSILFLMLGGLFTVCFIESMSLGLVALSLDLYDHGMARWQTLFLYWRRGLTVLSADCLYRTIVGLGYLLIIPGIYFSIKFYFYKQIMVDQNRGIIESFRQSFRMTKGVEWEMLVVLFINYIIFFLSIISFGLGLFIALPLSLLINAYMYRMIPLNTSPHDNELHDADFNP